VFKFQSIRGEAETYCPKDWGSSFPSRRLLQLVHQGEFRSIQRANAIHQEQVVRGQFRSKTQHLYIIHNY